MAERRMFAKSVVESARFLKMPVSSQLLYFHLGMNADDDGIVEAYSVLNLTKAHEDDLRVLFGKGFVKILNDDLVTYIWDWQTQNKIRPDRKKDSVYAGLLLQAEPGVELLERKQRSDSRRTSGPSTDGKMSAQCSAGKDSLGQASIKGCVVPEDTHAIAYRLGHEVLSIHDYDGLVERYSKDVVENVIHRILDKPYHNCLNMRTISEWCGERMQTCDEAARARNVESVHSNQLSKLSAERCGA